MIWFHIGFLFGPRFMMSCWSLSVQYCIFRVCLPCVIVDVRYLSHMVWQWLRLNRLAHGRNFFCIRKKSTSILFVNKTFYRVASVYAFRAICTLQPKIFGSELTLENWLKWSWFSKIFFQVKWLFRSKFSWTPFGKWKMPENHKSGDKLKTQRQPNQNWYAAVYNSKHFVWAQMSGDNSPKRS